MEYYTPWSTSFSRITEEKRKVRIVQAFGDFFKGILAVGPRQVSVWKNVMF